MREGWEASSRGGCSVNDKTSSSSSKVAECKKSNAYNEGIKRESNSTEENVKE